MSRSLLEKSVLPLYRAATTALAPALRFYLHRRCLRGKEDRERLAERSGMSARPRPEGRLLWIHAASVGESLSVLPLIADLQQAWRGWTVLITTGTVTSAQMMAERLPAGAFHQFVPLDSLPWVRRFLDHWRPDAALWVESEFWPNLMLESASRRLPMALVNGRLSQRSLRQWQQAPGIIARLLNCFCLCLAQSDGDAQRLRLLGAPNVVALGNLKMASHPLPAAAETLAAMTPLFAERPCWLAASTHAGEELAAWRVHQQVARLLPPEQSSQRTAPLLTVIVPRHPQRGDAVAASLRAAGAVVSQRSRHEPLTAATTVYLADTLGELGVWYRLCPVSFVGKSLPVQVGEPPNQRPGHSGGGQNPLEPARLASATLFGPQMENFPEVIEQMLARHAAVQITDEASLAQTLAHWLTHPDERHAVAVAGQAFASETAAVGQRVLDALAPLRQRAEATSPEIAQQETVR